MTTKSALKTIPLAAAMTAALVFGAAAHAQTAASPKAAPARETVKMETIDFLRTHRWDDERSSWMLKSGVDAPVGVKPRAEVKAERDTFLRANRWSTETSNWEPIKGGSRDMGTMSRAQVAAETKQFLATHTFDEEKGVYVAKTPRKTK